jgi:hypothetical protein
MPKKPHISIVTGTATATVSPDPCPVGGTYDGEIGSVDILATCTFTVV